MKDRAKAIIDTHALRHNLTVVKQKAPQSHVLAMVKANAYGHGLVAVSQILNEVHALGVACLDEAIKLREAGIDKAIVVMAGIYSLEELHLMAHYQLQIVIHDEFQIHLLRSAVLEQPISVWLEVDTGMHRLGFLPDRFDNAYELLTSCPNVKLPIILMTHLAEADDIQRTTTLKQLRLFQQHSAKMPGPRSIANSAGILAWPQSIADWNRPGIMLYGISPLLQKKGEDHGLKPVMTLTSKIAAIHNFQPGDAIGYGGTWICPEPMRVATIAIGYGDGYPRHAKNGTPVLINSQLCPLVGRVSMDLIMVDLRPCPSAKWGDEVILWGKGLPAEIIASYAETIAYELVCHVSSRVVFVYQ